MKQLIANTGSIAVYLDPSIPCIIHKQVGLAKNSTEFRRSVDLAEDSIKKFIHQYPDLNYMVEATEAGPNLPEDIEYSNQCLQLLKSAGVKKIAFIQSKEAFEKMNVTHTQLPSLPGIDLQVFYDLEKGADWLKKNTFHFIL